MSYSFQKIEYTMYSVYYQDVYCLNLTVRDGSNWASWPVLGPPVHKSLLVFFLSHFQISHQTFFYIEIKRGFRYKNSTMLS